MDLFKCAKKRPSTNDVSTLQTNVLFLAITKRIVVRQNFIKTEMLVDFASTIFLGFKNRKKRRPINLLIKSNDRSIVDVEIQPRLQIHTLFGSENNCK